MIISRSITGTWAIVLGLALGPAVSNGFGRFAYGLLLPAMRQDLRWTYTEAGWINTSNAIGYLVGALVALRLISVLGSRALFIGGLVMTTAALVLSGMTREFGLMNLWRFTAGVGGAPTFIAGSVISAGLFKHDSSRNSLAVAIYFGGAGAGMLLSGLSVPLALERWGNSGWPIAWLCLGLMSLLAAGPSIVAATRAPDQAATPDEGAQAVPLHQLTASLISYFLFAVGYIVYLTFIVARMRENHSSTTMVSVTWSTLGLAIMISPYPWRRLLASQRGGLTLGLACFAVGFSTLVPWLSTSSYGSLISALVFGLSVFIPPAAITAFVRRSLPPQTWGRSISLFTVIFSIGQIIGPVAAGWISDRFANISFGLVSAGITVSIAGCVALAQRPIAQRFDSSAASLSISAE